MEITGLLVNEEDPSRLDEDTMVHAAPLSHWLSHLVRSPQEETCLLSTLL